MTVVLVVDSGSVDGCCCVDDGVVWCGVLQRVIGSMGGLVSAFTAAGSRGYTG